MFKGVLNTSLIGSNTGSYINVSQSMNKKVRFDVVRQVKLSKYNRFDSVCDSIWNSL